MKRFIKFISFICVLAIGSNVDAIPKQISYQGTLFGSGGTPLADSTVNVEFRIYDALAGGNGKWVETQSVTTDGQGRFTVILGSVSPIEDTVFNQADRYLSINVESNGEMDPRAKMVSVPYSNRVSTVDGATGGNISGFVGLGVPSPTEKLDVDGSIAIRNNNALKIYSDGIGLVSTSAIGAYGTFDFYKTGDLNASVRLGHSNFPVARSFSILTGDGTGGATERFTILPTGNVGIGTTSPQANLHIAGPVVGKVMLTNDATGHGSTDGLHIGFGSGTSDAFIVSYESARLQLGVDNSSDLTIQSGGNVGIGTINPTEKLDVDGSIAIRNNNALKIYSDGIGLVSTSAIGAYGTFDFYKTGDLNASVRLGHSNFPVARSFSILTGDGTGGATERFTILPTGYVGIGTTSPAYKLEVSGPVMMEDVGGPPLPSAGHAGIFTDSSELYAIDDAGNTTKISPHDKVTGEWIFYSKNIKTGRVVRVDMEKLVRKVEELTGETFLMESWEKK